MPTEYPRQLLSIRYYEAAQEYLRSLPLEHFMESTPQATQREITLESFALVRAQRGDVHVYNELLVQHPRRGSKQPRQVVPDNMVVIHAGELKVESSYDVPLQPVGPFLVLEYVSRDTRRKDYDDNLYQYEHRLKVPYYLLFQPDIQELTLDRHTGRKYVSVKPNDNNRYSIAELELEVALLDGWLRYWFRGELLPLPAELLEKLRAARRQVRAARRLAREATRRAEDAERRLAEAEAELAQLRQELEQKRRRNNHK
jgi:Uma2 family endonuclease